MEKAARVALTVALAVADLVVLAGAAVALAGLVAREALAELLHGTD